LKPKSEVITLDIQFKTQETQELCWFGKTRHVLLRYGLLMEVENDELLIFNEPTNYIESISNIDS
jgi:hypothetical protein